MPQLDVDGLTFDFPDGWQASKYDEWVFYRNHFIKQRNGISAVDVVAVSLDLDAFLIEVKDYRHPQTVKPSDLPQAIASKVLHTLAALLPAKLHANDSAERQMAAAVLACKTLRVVVHIEQPKNHRPIVDVVDLQNKTRVLLRAVDRRLQVVATAKMQHLAWTVI